MRNAINTIRKFNINFKYLFNFLILFIFCIAPIISQPFYYNVKNIKVAQDNILPVSVKNTIVEQLIENEGISSGLKILFCSPSGRLYKNAEVKIVLKQDNICEHKTILASELFTNGYYESYLVSRIPAITEKKSMFETNLSLVNFKKGKILLNIEGKNFPVGTDCFVFVSKTNTSGLISAKANNHDLGYPLVIEYKSFIINKYFYYETIGLILLLFLVIFTSKKLSQENNHNIKNNSIYNKIPLFICSVFIIFLIVSIKVPYASILGEPRSEAAYEFWYNAHYKGFFENLMTLMSGEALCWLERIMMYLADIISPIKHVFKVAQTMELFFIATVCSMPCLTAFSKYANDLTRLLFAIILGTNLLFLDAYYFWSVSYWSLIFLINFSLLNYDKIRLPIYVFLLSITSIICLSRIFHIIFIPLAICFLLLFYKTSSKRTHIFCYTIIFSSLFECIYSLYIGGHVTNNGGIVSNIIKLGIFRIIENSIYYFLQAANCFITGNVHNMALTVNLILLLILVYVICKCIFNIYKKNNAKINFFIISLLFISIGTISLSVITSGTYDWVMFPINYSISVDWYTNIKQEADLHFAYTYISLFYLEICLILLFSKFLSKSKISNNVNNNILISKNAVITFALFLVMITNYYPRDDIFEKVPTQWSVYSNEINKDCYFVPINTKYGFAPISLERKSDELIYGVDKNGEGYIWNYGNIPYEVSRPYYFIDLTNISTIDNKEILSVTVKKAITNFNCPYYAVFFNKGGKEIFRMKQLNENSRVWIDFVFQNSIKDISRIEFYLNDGRPAPIVDGAQIGYKINFGSSS